MSNSMHTGRSKPEISIIITVSDDTQNSISKTLNSLLSQTLDKECFEVFLAENYPSKDGVTEFIKCIPDSAEYGLLEINVSHLLVGHSDLQSKVRMVASVRSEYVTFLCPGDRLDPDYLKKSVMAIVSSPEADWVYTNHATMGAKKSHVICSDFNPYNLMSLGRAATYRTQSWLRAARKVIPEHERWLYSGDHAIHIQLMSKGGFGVPVRDTMLHVAPSTRSVPSKIFMLAGYTTVRANLFRMPLLYRSARNARKFVSAGYGQQPGLFLIRCIQIIQRLASVVLAGMSYQKYFKYVNAFAGFRTIYFAAFKPKSLINYFCDPVRAPSLAELLSGFSGKPRFYETYLNTGSTGNSILFAHTNWMVGGAEQVLINWIKSARQTIDGKILEICERDRPGECDEEAKEEFSQMCDEQYNLDRLANTPQQRLDILWGIICRERPRIVFISGNALMYALLPRIKSEMEDIVVVDILHNEWHMPGDWFDVSYEYREYINQRITISDYWAERLHGYKERSEKIRIFPNGIDLEIFNNEKYPKSTQISRLGLPHNKIIVAFIGRLHDQKNPDVFFELARQFSVRSEFHFIVVGDGCKRKELLEQNVSMHNLTYFGLRTDIPQFISVADVLVYCSRFEGFPLASLEAAAMNRAVIAPNIVGFREQIEAGDFGLLYEPGVDIRQDAKKIADILLNRYEELQSKAENGRPYVMERHNDAAISKLREKYFTGLLAHAGVCSGKMRKLPRKKQLYLHIGLSKTGTSSIQGFADTNRKLLARHGLCYPDMTDGSPANHPVAWGFHRDELGVNPILYDLLGPKDKWRKKLNYFRSDLMFVDQDKILLSSEMLPGCHEDMLAEYLSVFDVKVIIFLRRQDHWLESTFNQVVKSGRLSSLSPGQHLRNRCELKAFDYHGLVSRWAREFGAENIIVVPFNKAFYQDGLEKNFVNLLGIAWDKNYKMSAYKNRSLNRDCTEYLVKVMRVSKMDVHAKIRIIQLLEEYSAIKPDLSQYKKVYSPAQRLDLLKECEAGNKEIAKIYLGRDDGILFEDPLPSLDEEWKLYPGLNANNKADIDKYLKENAPPGYM